jgi:hypothetical protein
MAKTYRLSLAARLINSVFRLMTRVGLGASYRCVLTVRAVRADAFQRLRVRSSSRSISLSETGAFRLADHPP